MKIEVNQRKDKKFELKIGDEEILVHEKLSAVVNKIEQYLKMRFLPEEQKGGVIGLFDKVMKGQ